MDDNHDQQPHEVIDISSWQTNDDFGVFSIGSKPKRSVICPDDIGFPFLIPGHTYLFKSAHDWRRQQLWSEVVAFRLSRLCGISVPPCFVAVDGIDHQPGVLIEFFYGYPDEVTRTRMVHGADLMQSLYPKEYDPKTGRPHSVQRNIALCRALRAPNAVVWWAQALGFDALIGNTDRHAENWALLRGIDDRWRMAPAYDNGTSLGYMIADDKLPLSGDALERHLLRGRHHISWLPNPQGPGNLFVDLCQHLCTASPLAKRVIGRLLPTVDAPIREILEPLTRFDVPVRFTKERAIFVEGLIRARRQILATGLGV